MIMEHTEIGKELKNLSGEWLNRSEFIEYINDYYNNSEEYDLDEDSNYFKAISFAYHNMFKAYDLYNNEF